MTDKKIASERIWDMLDQECVSRATQGEYYPPVAGEKVANALGDLLDAGPLTRKQLLRLEYLLDVVIEATREDRDQD